MKLWVVTSLLAMHGATVLAQQPAADADANSGANRAKRQADNPYKWIMILDDKPRQKEKDTKDAKEKDVAAAAKDKRPAPVAAPVRENAPTAVAVANPAPARPVVPSASSAPVVLTPAAPAQVIAAARPAPVAPSVMQQPSAPPTAAPEPTLASLSPKLAEEEFEEPLRPLKQVQPEMTRQIVNAGLTEGTVRVKFTVNQDGTISNAEVVKSSNRVFNSPVIAALNQWQYAPIKRPREAQAEISFDFSAPR